MGMGGGGLLNLYVSWARGCQTSHIMSGGGGGGGGGGIHP